MYAATEAIIPKTIHYVWVGGAPLTPLAKRCLASWQEHLSEYEIKRWDETNSPMEHPYVQAMYAKKKWAFVSDYIRFYALLNEGGIYLDTDQEICKTLDPLLAQKGFVGKSRSGQIESSVIAAVQEASFIRAAVAFYDNDTRFSTEDTSPLVLERALATAGTEGISIYDHTYFHPINEGELLRKDMRQSAYGVHHWAESWVPYAGLRKVARRLGLMKLIKKIID